MLLYQCLPVKLSLSPLCLYLNLGRMDVNKSLFLGLTDTKSCNLIAGSETKDLFSIPSSKGALHGAGGALPPPVRWSYKSLTPETDALAKPVPVDEVPNYIPTQATGK